MSRKIVLITGSTSGIGKDLVFYFAKHDIHLILMGRSKAKLSQLKSEIILKTECEMVDTVICDFTDLQQVTAVSRKIAHTYDHIDVMIHNAGALAEKKGMRIDLMPYAMVVNFLAPKILNENLLSLIEKSACPCILHTSSSTLPKKLIPFDLENMDNHGRIKAYGISKLCFYLYLTDLKDIKAKIKIFDPGIVYTNATKGMMPKYLKGLTPLIRLVSRMPRKVTQEVHQILEDKTKDHLAFYVKGKRTKLKPLYNDDMVKMHIDTYIEKIYH